MIFTKTGLNGNVRSDVPIPRSNRADYAINGDPLAGDREFESFSLQRGVLCEPDFPDVVIGFRALPRVTDNTSSQAASGPRAGSDAILTITIA